MVKLILTDMDGSLLDDQKRMPKDTFEVIQKCIDKDIIFGIASGRQMRTLQLLFPALAEKMMFVAENGAYSSYLGETIYYSAIDPTLIEKLLEKSKELKNAFVILCAKECAYVESDDPRLMKECDEYYKSCRIVEKLSDVKDEICKFCICDFSGAEGQAYPIFSSFKDVLQVTLSGQIWVDICNPNQNKGQSVEAVQKKYGISKEETMAFGDYLNDESLLDAAGYSYAMKNAHPDLMKHANYVTELDNNEGGVIETIKKMVL